MNSEHRSPSCARRFVEYLSQRYPDAKCEVRLLEGGFKQWEKHFHHSEQKENFITTRLDELQCKRLFCISEAHTEDSLPPIRSEDTLPEGISETPTITEDILPTMGSGGPIDTE